LWEKKKHPACVGDNCFRVIQKGGWGTKALVWYEKRETSVRGTDAEPVVTTVQTHGVHLVKFESHGGMGGMVWGQTMVYHF
jgi:hypothetical protein